MGIAQNVQRRSQPLASLRGAVGDRSSRVRGATGALVRSAGLIGRRRLRSCGVCGWWVSPATIDRSRAAMSG